ncbi:hypothetical protein VNO77_44192 [Canavalia gladiata]|uniref:Uncharacterized protein n=1 Tax=Canavalia gladiata TaxID=3824 RepID=A0AAN9JXM0_CANGL
MGGGRGEVFLEGKTQRGRDREGLCFPPRNLCEGGGRFPFKGKVLDSLQRTWLHKDWEAWLGMALAKGFPFRMKNRGIPKKDKRDIMGSTLRFLGDYLLEETENPITGLATVVIRILVVVAGNRRTHMEVLISED